MVLQIPTGNATISMKQIRLADLSVGLIGLVAAAASLWTAPGTSGFLGAGLALLMLVIAVIDHRYLIIPNELTAAAAALALVNAAVSQTPSIVDNVVTAALRGLITMLFFLGLRLAYGCLRQREGLGLGDVKLAFVAGAWLEWAMIPVAVEIAALAAILTYIVPRISPRPINTSTRLPFGLFFAPAIWLSWLFGVVFFAF
jgi:leader peptidase (prepilin peptidase)/N-methyltransferase